MFLVFLPERFFGKIKVGDTVEVEINGKVIKAPVIEVAPAIDPMSRSFLVKVKLPEKCKVGSGKSAYVNVYETKKEKVILIPEKAVFKWGDFTAVYTVDNRGIIRLRFVRLGLKYGDKYEVLAGLKPGDVIVVDGITKACDGCLASIPR